MIVVLLIAVSLSLAKRSVPVTTPLGNVVGFLDDESNTTCFYGLPYAKPPVGGYRFTISAIQSM